MKEDFLSIRKALDSIYSKNKQQPIRVKLNPEWAKQNIEQVTVRGYQLKLTDYTTIYGIPVEFDESIESYEFVYEDGKY